jgi:hypothetical protein
VTFRVRLTLLFVVTLALLGALSSAFTYAVIRDRLATQDRRAAQTLATTAAIADTAEIALDRIAAPNDSIWLITPTGRIAARSYHSPGSSVQQVRAYVAQATSQGLVTASAHIPGGGTAIVLHSTAPTQSALGTVRRTLILADLIAVAFAAVAGGILAARALRSVDLPGRSIGCWRVHRPRQPSNSSSSPTRHTSSGLRSRPSRATPAYSRVRSFAATSRRSRARRQ